MQYKALTSQEMLCYMLEVKGQPQQAVEVASEQQQLGEQAAPEQQVVGQPNSKEKSQRNQLVTNPDVSAEYSDSDDEPVCNWRR